MSIEAALNEVSQELGIKPADLRALISFESSWNPAAKNPKSSARGLLQFIDSTAKGLGYKDSADLVAKNPTAEAQLLGPVRKYLKQYTPFPSPQSLYMAVFYPAARYWEPSREFPEKIKKVNPGIKTPLDYVKYVQRRINTKKKTLGGLGAVVFVLAAVIILKKDKK